MRERGLHLAIHSSRICMSEKASNEAGKSPMKGIPASMSRNSECAATATATTEHVILSKNMHDSDRHDCPWITELNETDKGKYSETSLISNSEASRVNENEDVDCQLIDTISCQNFACLNVNSNGRRTTTEGVHSVKDASTEPENNDSVKQMKQFLVGQFPFEPVGLSLSSSGVQLYMMVDYNEQEKSVPKVESETMTSTRKNLGKTTKPSKGNNQVVSASNVNVTRSCRNVHDYKDHKVDISFNNESQRCGLNTADEPLKVGAANRLQATQESRKRTYMCNSNDNKFLTPCCSKVPTQRQHYLDGKCADPHLMMSGPSWRFDNEEINVSNNENNRETFRNSDRYPEGSHQDKKVKRHYQNSSSDEDEEMPCQDDLGMKNIRATKTRAMTSHVAQRKRYTPALSKMIINGHEDSHLMSQTVEVSASSTSVFQANRSSSTVSADQMAKFKEYTETIRRNLKDDYRNLSNLIKSFSEDVEERNNNQSSQSRSHLNQPDIDEKAKNNDRCYLM